MVGEVPFQKGDFIPTQVAGPARLANVQVVVAGAGSSGPVCRAWVVVPPVPTDLALRA